MNQRGFSLVEVLVAAGLLSIVAMSVTTMVGNTTADSLRGRIQSSTSCMAEANRVLNNFKDRGLSRTRINFPVPSAPTYPLTVTTYTGVLAAQETGITLAHRWAEFIYGTPASGIFPLRPHNQIMGYMNTLQAIHNSAPGTYCPASASDPGHDSYNSVSIADLTGATLLNSGTAFIKIQPFDTTTGALVTCPGASVDIRPASPAASIPANLQRPPGLISAGGTGAGQNHPNTATVRVASVPTSPAVVEDRGWALTVTIQYNDRKNASNSCSVQEKFQYGVQPINTATLEFSDMSFASNTAVPDDTNTATAMNGTVRLDWNGGPRYIPADPTLINPTDTTFFGCGSDVSSPTVLPSATNYSPTVRLRLLGVRQGSIMMCRNLSVAAAENPTVLSTGVQRIVMGNPQRTLFYSSELARHSFFDTADTGVQGDLSIAGLYYPQSEVGGGYYCREADGCKDLPRFASGYNGTNPAPVQTRSTIDGVNFYHPISGNDYGRTTTSATWSPCETINVCGQLPSYAAFNAGPTTAEDAYHLAYNNLPVGCQVHIQMAEVDAAYNVRATDFREYIHERIPGNWLCRSGNTDPIAGHGSNEWFFSCRSTNPGPRLCSAVAANNFQLSCCMPYPFLPHDFSSPQYRFVQPSN